MKKYLLITLLFLGQVLLPDLLIAQSQLPGYHPERLPNPLTDIGVKARISQSNDGYFMYNYEIYNSRTNDGRITIIDIDIQRGGEKADLRIDGLPTAQRCHIPMDLTTTVTPVGMESPPNWICGVGTNKKAYWGAHDYPYHILPGQTLSGMIITSYGLPSIRDITVMPLIKNSIYPNIEKYDIDMDELRKVMIQDRERLSFKSVTVGPTSPPENFKPVDFLDYIVSLKKDAYYQGWIIEKNAAKDRDRDAKNKKDEKYKGDDKEASIMNSFDKKLDHARAELVRGDNREAIKKLKSFIHEVTALYKEGKDIHRSHITSEAFALLYYNAQYLIDQLDVSKKELREKKEGND